MPLSFIERIVVGLIVIVGLFFLYRALKEPLDLLFSLIFRGIVAIKNKIIDWKDSNASYYEEIRYG